MLKVRQIFNQKYHSYTYIVYSTITYSSLIIDPILDDTEKYQELISELNIKLTHVFETHLHADHITGAAIMCKNNINCSIAMGIESNVNNIDIILSDNKTITINDITIKAIHTPGHTKDSYSLLINSYLFTGDVLLIRKTGRSDLPGGSSEDQYNSIKNKLFRLPPCTTVYPGHDYSGYTSSSIEEEISHNKRLANKNISDYINIMDALLLSKPKLIDQNLSANYNCGYCQLSNYE